MSGSTVVVKPTPGAGSGVTVASEGRRSLRSRNRATRTGWLAPAAGDRDLDRQAGGRVGPDVDRADRGRRVGGYQPQAGRVHPGHPLRRQPRQVVGGRGVAQQPAGQFGRQQVGGPGQPDRLASRGSGSAGCCRSPTRRSRGWSGRCRSRRSAVTTSARHWLGERYHASWSVMPSSSVLTSPRSGRRRQAEVDRALRVALVRRVGRGQDARPQRGRGQRRGRHGQRGDDDREPAQQGDTARHNEPTAPRLVPDDAHGPWRPRVVTTLPQYDAEAGHGTAADGRSPRGPTAARPPTAGHPAGLPGTAADRRQVTPGSGGGPAAGDGGGQFRS